MNHHNFFNFNSQYKKKIYICDKHIHKMQHNSNTIKKRVPLLFNDVELNNYYFASTGITNLTLTTYNEFIHHQAVLFFNILDNYQSQVDTTFEYAVFAGNSVGLLRDGNNLPWGDDYDIIIFDKDVEFFSNTIARDLENFGFKITTKIENNKICGIRIFGPTVTFIHNSNSNNYTNSTTSTNVFQCDVFFSYFDIHKYLKNFGGWGIYHQKNIPYHIVLPFKRRMFHGMFLPFFNNPQKEVEICYSNIDKCSIFSHHLKKTQNNSTGTIFYNKWKNAYLDFKCILEKSIENTKNIINAYDGDNSFENKNKLVLNADNKHDILGRSSCITSKLNFFCYLSQHNIGSIIAHANASEFICQHAIDVKFYFPKIHITYIDDGCKPSPISPIFYIYIDTFIQETKKK